MRRHAFGLLVIVFGCGTESPPPAPQCEPCPECECAPQPAVSAAHAPDQQETLEEDEPPTLVAAGACDTAFLPPSLVMDVDDETASALVEMVTGWMTRRHGPALDFSNGTVFAKSEDDSGADPPYPSFVGRVAERACGAHQLWLRQHARVLLEVHASPGMGDGVRCSENVCCYSAAGEFDSSGTFVFVPAGEGGGFTLRAVALIADNGTLGEEWIDEEIAWVTAALGRETRGRCAGEPRVVW